VYQFIAEMNNIDIRERNYCTKLGIQETRIFNSDL